MKKLFLLLISACVYFGTLQAAIPGVSPVISDDTNETWYIIQFKNSGKVIQDMGDGEKLQIVKNIDWSDDQLWKIIATDTEGEYQLVGKSGRKIALTVGGPGYADGNRYGASSTLATNFKINYCGAFVFDIERVGSPNHEALNKKENGDGGEVGEWTNKDNSSDNHVYFVQPKEMPKISDADNEYWYNIIFERSQSKEAERIKAFTYKGEDTNLQQETLNATNFDQLWKLVKAEDADEYYIINKNGAYIFEASTLLNDFYKITDIEEDSFQEVEGDADTLAGLILEIKGELPHKDEVITYKEHQFKILEVDNRRIKKIQYKR